MMLMMVLMMVLLMVLIMMMMMLLAAGWWRVRLPSFLPSFLPVFIISFLPSFPRRCGACTALYTGRAPSAVTVLYTLDGSWPRAGQPGTQTATLANQVCRSCQCVYLSGRGRGGQDRMGGSGVATHRMNVQASYSPPPMLMQTATHVACYMLMQSPTHVAC